jgi:hypothetical protein
MGHRTVTLMVKPSIGLRAEILGKWVVWATGTGVLLLSCRRLQNARLEQIVCLKASELTLSLNLKDPDRRTFVTIPELFVAYCNASTSSCGTGYSLDSDVRNEQWSRRGIVA